MHSVTAQILALHSQGVKTEDIASELDVEVESVKLILTQQGEGDTFTPVDFATAKSALRSCLSCEEYSTRFRAARFIINEIKGRNDIVKNLQQLGSINVLVINQQMLRAKQAIEKSKNNKIIDILEETPKAS